MAIKTFASRTLLSLSALTVASCGYAANGDSAVTSTQTDTAMTEGDVVFETTSMGTFDEPWAMAFAPGSDTLFITELPGTLKFVDTSTGAQGTVTGLPQVDYGGQGGLGDIAFLPSEANSENLNRTIYLSWAEAGEGDTRGAVVGKGDMVCLEPNQCEILGLEVIWRQSPKVSGRGHYSHRIAISPDEQYLFISSGDRQKQDPAQDTSNTLGTIVRLTLDGDAAAGNPLAAQSAPSNQIWSWGHRNVLGLQFDDAGRLWDLEHGPAGGDELNLVMRGENYGWPLTSDGDNYNGTPIPDNDPNDPYRDPVVNWTPVIAPGDFIFYGGSMFSPWNGDALIAGLKTQAIIRVDMNGENAREVARYSFDNRLRDIAEGPDGAIWVIEDGDNGRLLRLSPA